MSIEGTLLSNYPVEVGREILYPEQETVSLPTQAVVLYKRDVVEEHVYAGEEKYEEKVWSWIFKKEYITRSRPKFKTVTRKVTRVWTLCNCNQPLMFMGHQVGYDLDELL